MATVSPLYDGSRLFLIVTEKTGVPLDQINFVCAQFFAIFLGFILRCSLPQSLGKPLWRSLFCLLSGLALLYFMIGWSMWIILLQVGVCYLLLRYLNTDYMQLVVFFFAIGFMLVMYVLRNQKYYDDLCYDATYPLMITTQKVTSLAFSINDWKLHLKGGKMQEERLKWSVRKMPSFLEYFSFTLSFQGILAGPFCHYNSFKAFIEGNSKERLQENNEAVVYMDDPSTVVRAVVSKIAGVFMWIFITAVVQPKFPESKNVDPEFIASYNILTRFGYLYMSLFFQRAKYYVSWIMADAVYNASGLGYVGKDKEGKPLWTGMSNVFVWKIETATSLKVYLDNWNIMTSHWLRHVCYMRAPFLNTLLTFVLSALWHGLFIGYYVTFVSAAFFVQAGRKIRQNIRPLFQSSEISKFIYEVITFLGTQISLCFLVLSFVILHWEPTIRFHSSFYWCCHIIVGSLAIMLPSKRAAREESQSQQKDKVAEPQKGQPDNLSKEQEDLLPDGDFRPRKREVMSVQKS